MRAACRIPTGAYSDLCSELLGVARRIPTGTYSYLLGAVNRNYSKQVVSCSPFSKLEPFQIFSEKKHISICT